MTDGWFGQRPERDRDRGPSWPDWVAAVATMLVVGMIIAGIVGAL